MADTNYLVSNPTNPFTTPRSFKSIANGKIYIGQVDTDPANPVNQIPVYLVNEEGSELQIAQPIIINAGGFPVYNGQIAKFITKQNYSMAVYDAYGAQQYYWENIATIDPYSFIMLLSSPEGAGLLGLKQGGTVQDGLGCTYASSYGVALQTAQSIRDGVAVDMSDRLQAAINAARSSNTPLVLDYGLQVGPSTSHYIYIEKTINISGLREIRGAMYLGWHPDKMQATFHTPDNPPRPVALVNANGTFDANGKIFFSTTNGGQTLDTIETSCLLDSSDDKWIGQLHITAYSHFNGQLWARRCGTGIRFANAYDNSFAGQVACVDSGSINYDAFMVGSYPYADKADESNSLTFPRVLLHTNRYRDGFIEGSKITIGGIHSEACVVGSISGMTPYTRDGFTPNGICTLWIALTGGSVGNINYNISSSSSNNGCLLINVLGTNIGEIYTDEKSDILLSDVFFIGRGGDVSNIYSKSDIYTDGGSPISIGSVATTKRLRNGATRSQIGYADVNSDVILNAGAIDYLKCSGSVTQNQYGYIRGGQCSGDFAMSSSGRLEHFTVNGKYSSSAASAIVYNTVFNGDFLNSGSGNYNKCSMKGFPISSKLATKYNECNISSNVTVGVESARAEFTNCSVSGYDFTNAINPIVRINGGSATSIVMNGQTGVIAIDMNVRMTSGIQINGFTMPTYISGVGYGTKTINPYTGNGYMLTYNSSTSAAEWINITVRT
ncbi:phage tailspike protein [Pluralibacter gergoviae]|uniref:phage tailspike protein n=1 Tax=Pluralibacter gergoviae TaxID=61647 RepID=UPI00290D96F8|nr:phage tailspike protein [Pluralibacter gergoviae]MDU4001453.1 phage tailspike protein [Pluralibacter gergoviae]